MLLKRGRQFKERRMSSWKRNEGQKQQGREKGFLSKEHNCGTLSQPRNFFSIESLWCSVCLRCKRPVLTCGRARGLRRGRAGLSHRGPGCRLKMEPGALHKAGQPGQRRSGGWACAGGWGTDRGREDTGNGHTGAPSNTDTHPPSYSDRSATELPFKTCVTEQWKCQAKRAPSG